MYIDRYVHHSVTALERGTSGQCPELSQYSDANSRNLRFSDVWGPFFSYFGTYVTFWILGPLSSLFFSLKGLYIGCIDTWLIGAILYEFCVIGPFAIKIMYHRACSYF